MKIITSKEGGLLILPETPFEISYLDRLKVSKPEISFFNLGELGEQMGGLKIVKASKEKMNGD